MTEPITAIDLFCGPGGLSFGFAEACEDLDLDVELIAINHDKNAIQTHETNHPWATQLNMKVEDPEPTNVVDPEDVDVIIAAPECTHFSSARGGKPVKPQKRSSPMDVLDWVGKLRPEGVLVENVPEFCFPADTMVLTENGPEPIQQVEEGTRVLTHKNRWREVTSTSKREGQTITISAVGNNLLECTPNHEIYAREISADCWGGKRGRHVQELKDPAWVQARSLSPSTNSSYEEKYVGYKSATPREFPDLHTPEIESNRVTADSDAFWKMVGLWLGDGWFYKRRGRRDGLRIAGKKNELKDDLESVDGLSWNEQYRERTETYVYETSCKELASWLFEHFGEYADGKTLPGWIFSLEESQRVALLKGYQQADGSVKSTDNRVRASSASKQLIIGLKHLLESLGIAASIPRPSEFEQDSQNTMYHINWVWDLDDGDNDLSTIGDDHRWTRVNEVEEADAGVPVYDLTVKEDHSYVADGMVVHNCSWGPIVDGEPTRDGSKFEAWVGQLEADRYSVNYTTLNAADYGDATSRRRFFVMARRDFEPEFPEPTHSRDGDEPGTEPWRSAAEIIDFSERGSSIWSRSRPLVSSTMERIAAGIRNNCDEALAPFADVIEDLDAVDVEAMQQNMVHVDELEAEIEQRERPFLVHGPTQVPEDPTDLDRAELCVPMIMGQHSNAVAKDASECPTPTIAKRGAIHYFNPDPFVLPRNGPQRGLHSNPAYDPEDRPLHTVTAKNHDGHLVSPFLIEYYGQSTDQSLEEPVPTVTTKDRHALIVPELYPWGLDIQYRMLQPRELKAAQGFPDDYHIVGNKTETTKQIGNAVPVSLAKSLCKQLLLPTSQPTISKFDPGENSNTQALQTGDT